MKPEDGYVGERLRVLDAMDVTVQLRARNLSMCAIRFLSIKQNEQIVDLQVQAMCSRAGRC